MSSRPKYYNSHASATIPPFLVQHDESDEENEPLYEEPSSIYAKGATPSKPLLKHRSRSTDGAVHSGEIQFSTPVSNNHHPHHTNNTNNHHKSDGIGVSPIEKGDDAALFSIEINNEISFGNPKAKEPPIHSPTPTNLTTPSHSYKQPLIQITSDSTSNHSSDHPPIKHFKISPNNVHTSPIGGSDKNKSNPIQVHSQKGGGGGGTGSFGSTNSAQTILTPLTPSPSPMPQMTTQDQKKSQVENLTQHRMEREQQERNRKLQELQERRKQMMAEDTDSKLQSELERIIQRRRERAEQKMSQSSQQQQSSVISQAPSVETRDVKPEIPTLSSNERLISDLLMTPSEPVSGGKTAISLDYPYQVSDTIIPLSDSQATSTRVNSGSYNGFSGEPMLGNNYHNELSFDPVRLNSNTHSTSYPNYSSSTNLGSINDLPNTYGSAFGENNRSRPDNFDFLEDLEINTFLKHISPVKSNPEHSFEYNERSKLSDSGRLSPGIMKYSRNRSSDSANPRSRRYNQHHNNGYSGISKSADRSYGMSRYEHSMGRGRKSPTRWNQNYSNEDDEPPTRGDSWRITDSRAELFQAHNYISKETQELLEERDDNDESLIESHATESVHHPSRDSRSSYRASIPLANNSASRALGRSPSSPSVLQHQEHGTTSPHPRNQYYAPSTAPKPSFQPLSPLDQRFSHSMANMRRHSFSDDRETTTVDGAPSTITPTNKKSLHYLSKQHSEGVRIELTPNFMQSMKRYDILARHVKNEEEMLNFVAHGMKLWKCTSSYMKSSHKRYVFVDRSTLTFGWCSSPTKKSSASTIPLKDIETVTLFEMPTQTATKKFGLKKPRNNGMTVYGLIIETNYRVIEFLLDLDLVTACTWVVGVSIAAQKSKDLYQQRSNM